MSSTDPLAVLAVDERNSLESLLMEFDAAWEPNSLDAVGPQIASHPDPQYRELALGELVKIDLQRRWAAGSGKLLEDYLNRFPALGTAESVNANLIVAEYEARLSVAPELALSGYQSRFPNQFPQVEQLASQASRSSLPVASPPDRTEKEVAQASIDTSRVDQLRDTKGGGQRNPKVDLPVEFGRYRILKELGAGAMGKVYLAHDSQLDRQVALKTPNFSGADADDTVTRFFREARSAAKLQHRNICPIYDVGKIDGRYFISMAFIKGRCMSQFIKPDRLPPARTSAILVQRLAVALAEAHRHNVVHRDLKPANIMIDLKKEPIVMDFGLARQMDVESRVTQSGMAVGTPAYMSPEQVRGELDEVGAAADIYALGVILYEMLTGRLPFRGPIAKVVYGIVHETPDAPSSIRKGLDPELESICGKMMAKDLAERYRSMEEVAIALKAYLKAPRKAAPTGTASSQASAASASDSSTVALTETGALNAFFAAQPDSHASGTLLESALLATPAVQSTASRKSAPRTSTGGSRGNHRRRRLRMVAGFSGGAVLLLGIVVYFKGGRIELDAGSDAVVKVGNEGTLTITPEAGDKQVRSQEPERKSIPSDSENSASPAPAFPASSPSAGRSSLWPTDGNPTVLNEWSHSGANFSNCYLASLAPDGQRVAYRIGEGPLKISETESKQLLTLPAEMEDAISIAFSLDQRLIATGHDNKKIRLWDAVSFAPFGEPFEAPIEQRVAWVHLSDDGSKLIAMSNDHEKLRSTSTFYTWEISTRQLISQFQVDIDSQSMSDSIDASADGSRVAVISHRNGAMLWDTSTGKRLPVEFEIDERLASMMRITGMDLSADGSRLAYGTLWGGPSYAAILDTSTGKELWNSGKQKGRVHCVQFTHDGRWLASTTGRTQEHQLSLWNVATGAEVHRWTYPYDSDNKNADGLKFMCFSEDGSRLMIAGAHTPVVVWNLVDKAAQDLPSETSSKSPAHVRSLDVVPPLHQNNSSENGSLSISGAPRAAAEQIVGLGGYVRLVDSGKWIDTLPDGDLRIEGVWFFRKQKQFNNGHLALLEHLPELQTVYFNANEMNDEGFATLAEMENVVENVKDLRFLQAEFGLQGLTPLAKLKRLENLALWHTNLINDDLKLLANFPALKQLTLQQYSKKKFGPAFLSDDCLNHLRTVSGLEKLTLIGEPFTDAGLATITDLKIEELGLGTPNVTDLAIAQLQEQRPRLGITRFGQTPSESDENNLNPPVNDWEQEQPDEGETANP